MAAGYHPSQRHQPQNTVVVMPKTPPLSRSALWLVFWGVGVLMGIVLTTLLQGPDPAPVEAQGGSGSSGNGIANGAPPPTFEVNVRAVLELPTETPTALVIPTSTTAAVAPTINECSAAQPGAVCQVPFPPQPTATPYPSCLRMDYLTPGAWCEWPAASPTPAWWAGQ